MRIERPAKPADRTTLRFPRGGGRDTGAGATLGKASGLTDPVNMVPELSNC
jgi:hypothetical protein